MRKLSVVALLLASCSIYQEPDPPPSAPPVSGGSLLVTRDGRFAIASDPARDKIFKLDLAARQLVAQIDLQIGDQPGRLIEDGAGRVHVVLRGGSSLVTLQDDTIASRRNVCPEPRGVAWQEIGDLVHVACAGGELVTFPAAGGDAVRRVQLDRDLRDIVVFGEELRVTRFRAAEILRIDATGRLVSRRTPASTPRVIFTDTGELVDTFARPSIAWRAIPGRVDEMILVHHRATGGPLSVQPGGYASGGDCGDGPIEATAWILDTSLDETAAPAPMTRKFMFSVLPVDIAMSRDGNRLAVVQVGTRTVRLVTRSGLSDDSASFDPCGFDSSDMEIVPDYEGYGAPLAVQFTPVDELVIQYDNAIVVDTAPLSQPGVSHWYVPLSLPYVHDPGRIMFHKTTNSGLACASCHPEGREDGLVWDFGGAGRRRTQHIGGFLLERAPYHWNGDQRNIHALANEVFVSRMGGDEPEPGHIGSLEAWLGTIPAMKPTFRGDFTAIERGRGLFTDLDCASCHSGPLYTNNALTDVGTGGLFKVPSLLGVGSRAPYLHDGCALTLADRFGPCGGDQHGATADLTQQQIDDLVAFLETL